MDSEQVFIDWITIRQTHADGGLPLIHDGYIISLDSEGNPIYQVHKNAKISGSYETGLVVRCDGSTVYLSGNVSAFNRPDNVFGYSLGDVVIKANYILGLIGLPPFTSSRDGMFVERHNPNSGLTTLEYKYEGAIITRLDLTCNYELGIIF